MLPPTSLTNLTTKVDIISGFLGAGKTTLINQLLLEIGDTERVAVVENEIGEIGVDGDVLGKHSIEVREVTNGCICCSLFGDFVTAMCELLDTYELDRIIVEPTGIGRISDVLKACSAVRRSRPLEINILATVVDCTKYHIFSTMFGDFFSNQIGGARTLFLSHAAQSDPSTIEAVRADLQRINPVAEIVDCCWEQESGELLALAEKESDPGGWSHTIESAAANVHLDFESWSVATNSPFEVEDLRQRLQKLSDEDTFGKVVRGKGVVRTSDGKTVLFDYLPGEINVREVNHDGDGKIVIIGPRVDKQNLQRLFAEEMPSD